MSPPQRRAFRGGGLPFTEAMVDAAVELGQAVGGFGTTVVGGTGVDVGQERLAPLRQRATEAGDLRDRARRERGEDALGDPTSVRAGVLVKRGAQ